MPLTNEEMTKISKSIFYAEGMNISGRWVINKEIVLELLNDYSPNMKVKLSKKDGRFMMDLNELA